MLQIVMKALQAVMQGMPVHPCQALQSQQRLGPRVKTSGSGHTLGCLPLAKPATLRMLGLLAVASHERTYPSLPVSLRQACETCHLSPVHDKQKPELPVCPRA